MKVLALGGCGDMGRAAVVALLSSPIVSSITVADKNYELAKAFIELADSDKLSATEIDVTEQDQLVALMSKHDVVMNTVGPYFKFGKMILEAAIKAKKHYVDICDDWKPMQEILEMGEQAKRAGITAIVGIGESPGILNLMTVKACSDLDEIDEVRTAWGIGGFKMGKKPPHFVRVKDLRKRIGKKPAEANAAMVHLLHESVGKIPTFKDGRLVDIEALTEAEPFKFPGLLKFYAVHIGHPEPVMLSRTIKANSISNLMLFGKTVTNEIRKYARKIENNKLTVTEAAMKLGKTSVFLERLLIFYQYLIHLFRIPKELCVTVTGVKEGARKKIGIGLKRGPYGDIIGGMDGATGVPLAIAALMILEGKIKEAGVLTPEEAIDPEDFFNRFASYCGKNLSGKDILIKKEVNL